MLGVDLDGACCEKLVVPGKAVIKIPDELTDHEAAVLRDVTTWWKNNRNWLEEADDFSSSPD